LPAIATEHTATETAAAKTHDLDFFNMLIPVV